MKKFVYLVFLHIDFNINSVRDKVLTAAEQEMTVSLSWIIRY